MPSPTTYVALLRGVNVGGKNILPMAALADTFREEGFASVRTYIQSGNVLFQSPLKSARALERRIEKALRERHAVDTSVVLRSREELDALVRSFPPAWKKPSPKRRYYVLFLRHGVDAPTIVDEVTAAPDVDDLVYRPGTLLWSAEIAKLGRSRIARITQTKIYKEMTIRNLNTTLKLSVLAQALDAG